MEADGLESWVDFVPLERAVVDCSLPRQVSGPVAFRAGAMLRGELHPGDGLCEGFPVGVFPCSWRRRQLGHPVVWLLRAFAACSYVLIGAKMSWRLGEAGGCGAGSRPGHVVTCRVLWILLYGHGGGGVVLGRPSLWIVVQGSEGDGVVIFPPVESQEGVEAVPGVPGWAWLGCGCRLQEGVLGALPIVLPDKVIFWAPLAVATPHLPPALEGRMGRGSSWGTCW